MLRRLAMLAFFVALAACGDDGPSVARPDQLALQIVRGDRQVARVADAPASQGVAGYSPAATVPDNILPEPLVARIVIDGQPPSAALSPGDPLGPSFAVLPPGTAVTFRVIQPSGSIGNPCGTSFIDAAVPDDSGYVVTFWEKGTRAGECRMEVRLVVDRQPRVDTVFVATFTPGPVAGTFLKNNHVQAAAAGDTIDIRTFVDYGKDAYYNRIEADTILALPDSLVSWEWSRTRTAAADLTGEGWLAMVPDPVERGYWHRVILSGNVRCWMLEAYLTPEINKAPAAWIVVEFEPPEGATPPGPEPLCRDVTS